MKYIHIISAITGAVLAVIIKALGGWDKSLELLIVVMVSDYITGVLCAATGNSKKSNGLNSQIGFKGLCKKLSMLVAVWLATSISITTNFSEIREIFIFTFISNELLSIVENLGLMGIPLPHKIMDIIEVLKERIE